MRPREGGIEQRVDTRDAVDTPERVTFRHQLAGPGRRGTAWIADLLIRAAVVSAAATAIALLFGTGSSTLAGVGEGALLLLFFAVEWGYGALFETAWSGRTPGKFLLGIRVVQSDGGPASWPAYLLRNLVKAADLFPMWTVPVLGIALPTCGVALLSMTLDPKLRRLGDLVAGTVVVVEQRSRLLDPIRIEPPLSADERASLPADVRLSHGERRAIEAFLRRRPLLTADRAEELAELLAPDLAERSGLHAARWERVLALAYARVMERRG